MEIQAAVLRKARSPYRIETLELKDPEPGHLLVRIAGTGFCHTDTMIRSLESGALPLITGHEGAGVVHAVGPGTRDFRPGDHVVLSFDSCGSCEACYLAHPAYCTTFMTRNIAGRAPDGSPHAVDEHGRPVGARWFGQSSFATHALATTRNAVKVDPELPLEFLGPLGCSMQTGAGSVFNVLRVCPGTGLGIFGTGAVGLAAVMAARTAGATTVVAVDVHQARLDLARELGATKTFHGTTDDLAERIRAHTGGGLHYALDTTGSPRVVTTALAALRPGAVLGLIGAQSGELRIGPTDLAVGRTLVGIVEGDAVPQQFIPRLIGLWRSGQFPFDKLIKTYPLGAINEAEQASLQGTVVKPVLVP